MALIKVLVVKPGEAVPQLEEIEDELESFQKMVGGGYVQCVPLRSFGHGLQLWCDEEGLLKNLPQNRIMRELAQWIHGPFFITGRPTAAGMSRSVPSSVVPQLLAEFTLVERARRA